MSDYDGRRDGIWLKTDFKDNGFGIDPEGCGCTDCLTGQAFHPSDTWRISAAIRQGRPLYNRSGHEVILPNGYRLDNRATWRPGMFQHHCPGCGCFAEGGL
ncbi:hypothetical protein [Nocardia thailandica]|uniref:hypothetical protein n=1 Tax=Nocardia thailandica TaxID=257275 RepID=UPI0002E683DC|nr:hypothetical protein [Nocardia thailandica]